jgi:hypothetical protein
VALGQVFFLSYVFPLVSVISQVLHTYSFI